MEEEPYLNLVVKVLNTGEFRETRNAEVYSLFGESLTFDLSKGRIPLFTTKQVSFKNVFEELLFFLNGYTDSKKLEAEGVNIWKGNTNSEFLKSRKLDYVEGDMGPMYGFQWNHFGAKYKGCHHDYTNQGVNQIDKCVQMIKENPTSRRIMFSAFDPSTVDKAVLEPCHTLFQFYVRTDRSGFKYLDGQLYQRSADLMLGVPYNILSYSLLIIIIARFCQLRPGTLRICFGDVHIYSQHLNGALEQIRRIPKLFPKYNIKCPSNTPIRNYKLSDFEIIGYDPQPNIKMKMVA